MVINSVSVLSPRQDPGPLMSVGAIGSTSVTFLFDTGCDRSLLSAQLASSLCRDEISNAHRVSSKGLMFTKY